MTLTFTDAPDSPVDDRLLPFGKALTSAVDTHLDEATLAAAHRAVQRKAAIIAALYVGSYVAVLAARTPLMGTLACVALAASMAAVGFNISHDANHNALFATGGRKRLSKANRRAGLALNAIGGSSRRWFVGHVQAHHSAPNVVGRDYDIELNPFARLAPSQRRLPWHRFQHLYLWPLYSITAVAIFFADLVNDIQETVSGDKHGNRPSAADWAITVSTKTVFLGAMLGAPLLFHSPGAVIVGAIGVAALLGVLLGVVFQLAHTVEGAEFRDSEDETDCRWHEWQVRATVDFCPLRGRASKAVTWFVGGLNYQTIHHLFPTVPHTAYPSMAPVVAEVCARYDVNYQVRPTLRAALTGHYRHLRELGRPERS